MGETIDTADYGVWFSPLLPSGDHVSVLLVSAGIGLVLFCLGYLIAAAGGVSYLGEPGGYLGSIAAVFMLGALGVADGIYVDVWNEVRGTFAVDDEAYRAVVSPVLARVYDGRRVLGYAAILGVPYLYIVAVSHLPVPSAPLHGTGVRVFFGGELPYPVGVPSVVLLSLFGVVNALLVATIVNGLVNHLALVGEVSALPFRNVYASASELEPVAGFTVASATAWFAGTTLVVLWARTSIGGTTGTVLVVVLVATGAVFFAAPQLMLHDALSEAKREETVSIQAEYDEIHELIRTDADPPTDLSMRLEVADRRLENARSISTWVYNLSSVGKLAVASIIPWSTLVQQFL